MLTWAHPGLFLLLPLPFVVRYVLPPHKQTYGAALKVPFYAAMTHLNYKVLPAPRLLQIFLLTLIWILLVIAAAGPRTLGEVSPIYRSSRSLMIALDLSGSMQLKDMDPGARSLTRLDIVKETARKFIRARSSDLIGLILFGTHAYLQTPFTYDTQTLSYMLDDASLGLVGDSTAMGDAIGLSVKYLKQRPQKSRVLLLLTDGVNNAGTLPPLKAAAFAKKNHIKIYTIGLQGRGTHALFQTLNATIEFDETTLKKIASLTGGRFFRAHDQDELQKIYKTLDRLEPAKADSVSLRPIREYYNIPLAISFVLFMFCLIPLYSKKRA